LNLIEEHKALYLKFCPCWNIKIRFQLNQDSMALLEFVSNSGW